MRNLLQKDSIHALFMTALVISITLSMIIFPEPSFSAAERGLKVWWEIVLPALLPFFIAAELMMRVGVVHFMGVFMEPVMRPLFNVPGAGSFTMAMGIASGYPLGAALSARLKDDSLASKTEAERLVCFCNTSDPLFMTGAVAVGMFNRPDLAGIIVGAHYLSALTVGLSMKFWRKNQDVSPERETTEKGSLFTRAYQAMRKAQRGRPPFGETLGDSVEKSIKTLLLILGFMVLFSVIFEILKLLGAVGWISQGLSRLLPETLVPKSLHEALVSGFFEITIGCSLASATTASLYAKVAACSFIIAWSGLSVHAQVAAVIGPSKLSPWPYMTSRFVQGILAAIYAMILMDPASPKWSVPTFIPKSTSGIGIFVRHLGMATKTCLAVLLGFFVLAAAAGLIESKKP